METGKHERAFGTYRTVVESTTLVTPRNKHLKFRLPAGRKMHFKAGQFVQIFVPQPDRPRRTSYSIASAPEHEDFFELCVTLVDGGKSSTFIHNLKVGDEVEAMGPLGKFTQPDPLPRDVVFIATGSGIAPFRSMIYDQLAKKSGRMMRLLFGNRFDGDIIYQKDWENLSASTPTFKHFFTLSRPTDAWKGAKGYVQDKIAEFVPNPSTNDFYICGLSPMINAVQEKLLSLNVPKEQIHFEKFD